VHAVIHATWVSIRQVKRPRKSAKSAARWHGSPALARWPTSHSTRVRWKVVAARWAISARTQLANFRAETVIQTFLGEMRAVPQLRHPSSCPQFPQAGSSRNSLLAILRVGLAPERHSSRKRRVFSSSALTTEPIANLDGVSCTRDSNEIHLGSAGVEYSRCLFGVSRYIPYTTGTLHLAGCQRLVKPCFASRARRRDWLLPVVDLASSARSTQRGAGGSACRSKAMEAVDDPFV